MSALIIIYTSSGFIVAADGRISADEGTPVTEEISRKVTDNAQKIFPVSLGGTFFTYSMIGFVVDNKMTVDLDEQAAKSAASLSPVAYATVKDCLMAFCSPLKDAVVQAQRAGEIFPVGPERQMPHGRFAITEIHFTAYFEGQPFWVVASISHGNQTDVEISFQVQPLTFGCEYAHGSQTVPALAMSGDQRFVNYKTDLLRPTAHSLEEASKYAEAFIRLCADPLAVTVDPNCKTIGGHIHIAEITRHGFSWRIPPLPSTT